MALERTQEDDVACGEIDTARPSYLGSQETFYVRTMKRVDACISKPPSILIQNGRQQSSTAPRRPFPQQTCSTIVFYRSWNSKAWRVANSNPSWDRILRKGRNPRLPALLGVKRHRTHENSGASPANKWYLRTLSQNHPAGVSPSGVSAQAVSLDRRTAGRSGRMDHVLQQAHTSRKDVLRTHTDAKTHCWKRGEAR